MAKLKYRLGVDVGANSLGWCVYRLNDQDEPCGIQRLGARIFSDGRHPKTLASLAAERRLARQARRRRDRVLKRRHRLIEGLIRYGLMPADATARKELQTVDPYELRARGLDTPLSVQEFGRALYHLARKRGFKSSRKDRRDTETQKETGKVYSAIAALKGRITEAGCRTVGEYLAREHTERRPVRARRSEDGRYVLYLQRDMVAEEFDTLWAAQQPHHPKILSDEARDYLRDTLLFQRRLLPVKPGHCTFEPTEYRAPLSSPLQQQFRVLQELNNVRVRDGIGQRPLALAERNTMLHLMTTRADLVTWAQLAKVASLGNSKTFNLESEKRKGLRGDSTAAQFAAEGAFGSAWFAFAPDLKNALALLIERADDQAVLESALLALPGDLSVAQAAVRPHEHEQPILAALSKLDRPLTQAQASALAAINLPEDFGSLSLKALAKIVPEMEKEVVTYDVAVQRAGYSHHSQFYDGEFFQRLPYYGELLKGYTSPADKAQDASERLHGKIPNPTVHIGLNQLRQLVNALIKRYGHPHQIVIEMTREFGVSGQKRRDIASMQAENQERNDRYNAELVAIGCRTSRDNRLKLRLWEELGRDDALDRYCVYSGTRLSKKLLFSDEVEIDHILPFSRTLHDGVGNKLLCTRQANRDKGNRTPFEAFGHTPGWDDLVDRASRLPGNKSLLFRENALDDFLEGKEFLDRHLTDTAYLGRAAKQYLSAICPPRFIWVSSGRLTGMLRGKWGLNALLSEDSRKNRDNHRHHALDAAVIGICSRSLMMRLATAAAQAEAKGEQRLLEGLELPWPAFRADLQDILHKTVVSHRPDHGRQAALHNDTNYGWRGSADKSGNPVVGRHIPLDNITKANVSTIADPLLRGQLEILLAPLSSGKDSKAALAEFGTRTGIRRLVIEERLAVIPIRSRKTGEPYRYVKGDGNYCYEIFRADDGRWEGNVISTFEANRATFRESGDVDTNGRHLIMRLRKDDVLLIEDGDQSKLMRIAKFSDGKIALTEHFEANVDARNRDKSSGFKYLYKAPGKLKSLRARLVGVNILGYINDPGFRG